MVQLLKTVLYGFFHLRGGAIRMSGPIPSQCPWIQIPSPADFILVVVIVSVQSYLPFGHTSIKLRPPFPSFFCFLHVDRVPRQKEGIGVIP